MKYFKPKSLTWWASFVPLVAGLVVALSSALPELIPLANVINAMTGNVMPSLLITAGLVGIGFRAAPGMDK